MMTDEFASDGNPLDGARGPPGSFKTDWTFLHKSVWTDMWAWWGI